MLSKVIAHDAHGQSSPLSSSVPGYHTLCWLAEANALYPLPAASAPQLAPTQRPPLPLSSEALPWASQSFLPFHLSAESTNYRVGLPRAMRGAAALENTQGNSQNSEKHPPSLASPAPTFKTNTRPLKQTNHPSVQQSTEPIAVLMTRNHAQASLCRPRRLPSLSIPTPCPLSWASHHLTHH